MSQNPYGEQPNYEPNRWQDASPKPQDSFSSHAPSTPNQPPYAPSAYGQPTYAQAPGNQPPYAPSPHAQPGTGQYPHGQPPYAPSPYGQAPYTQAPVNPPAYGQDPYGQSPYAQPTPGQHPYGQPGYPQSPYGQPQPGQLQPAGLYGPSQYQPAAGRKEPAISLLVSFFVPGVGTIINGETGKGVGILVGFIVCAMLSWLLVPIAGMVALWIWGLVDAYQGAQRFNLAHGLAP